MMCTYKLGVTDTGTMVPLELRGVKCTLTSWHHSCCRGLGSLFVGMPIICMHLHSVTRHFPACMADSYFGGKHSSYLDNKQQLLLAHCLDGMLAQRAVFAGQYSPDDPAAHHCVERMLGEFPDPSNDPD